MEKTPKHFILIYRTFKKPYSLTLIVTEQIKNTGHETKRKLDYSVNILHLLPLCSSSLFYFLQNVYDFSLYV